MGFLSSGSTFFQGPSRSQLTVRAIHPKRLLLRPPARFRALTTRYQLQILLPMIPQNNTKQIPLLLHHRPRILRLIPINPYNLLPEKLPQLLAFLRRVPDDGAEGAGLWLGFWGWGYLFGADFLV